MTVHRCRAHRPLRKRFADLCGFGLTGGWCRLVLPGLGALIVVDGGGVGGEQYQGGEGAGSANARGEQAGDAEAVEEGGGGGVVDGCCERWVSGLVCPGADLKRGTDGVAGGACEVRWDPGRKRACQAAAVEGRVDAADDGDAEGAAE